LTALKQVRRGSFFQIPGRSVEVEPQLGTGNPKVFVRTRAKKFSSWGGKKRKKGETPLKAQGARTKRTPWQSFRTFFTSLRNGREEGVLKNKRERASKTWGGKRLLCQDH